MATVIGNSDNLGEPGVRGDSTQFNGVLGVSTASGHAGVAGVNESGGNGIFGRGSGNGVFGIHSGADGAGVVGTSDQNDGVRGFSAASAHSGVVGTNTGDGVGVLGQSAQGLAGKFEGNVEITGSLTVQGISIQSLLQRIQQLEQKLSGGTTPSVRQISVSKEGAGQTTVFTVMGTGFKPNSRVVIRITANNLAQSQFSETAGADGKFVSRHSVSCVSGSTLTFTAFEDANPTNTQAIPVVTTCP